MNSLMVMVCVVAVMGHCVSAKAYGGGGGGGGGGSNNGGGIWPGENNRPIPFEMGYDAPDEQGNSHFRKEEGDGNGNVRGSYGYKDSQGLYRVVDYTAGDGGFKASVRTNEPGTDGKENPADVIMQVAEPPAGLQEKYNRQSRNNYGQGGSGAGIFNGFGPLSGGMSQGQKSGKSGY